MSEHVGRDGGQASGGALGVPTPPTAGDREGGASQDGQRSMLETVRRIVSAVRATDLVDFELRHRAFRVRILRDSNAGPPADAPVAGIPQDAHHVRVVAPLTGVFYRAPSPTAKPYVEEGDWVDADSVIGLIETMKIFNEVTADRAGRVVSFAVPGGQLVHAGDTLVSIEPADRTAAEPQPS